MILYVLSLLTLWLLHRVYTNIILKMQWRRRKVHPPMKCPICKTALTVTCKKRYESSEEHVSNPNGTPYLKEVFQCPNEKCIAHTSGLEWIKFGEYCGSSVGGARIYPFINGNSAPFNSLERRLGTESCFSYSNKKHLAAKTWTILKAKKWHVNFRWIVRANENGTILDLSPTIEVTVASKGTWTHRTSGIHMYFYCLKDFRRHLKNFHYMYRSDVLRRGMSIPFVKCDAVYIPTVFGTGTACTVTKC